MLVSLHIPTKHVYLVWLLAKRIQSHFSLGQKIYHILSVPSSFGKDRSLYGSLPFFSYVASFKLYRCPTKKITTYVQMSQWCSYGVVFEAWGSQCCPHFPFPMIKIKKLCDVDKNGKMKLMWFLCIVIKECCFLRNHSYHFIQRLLTYIIAMSFIISEVRIMRFT